MPKRTQQESDGPDQAPADEPTWRDPSSLSGERTVPADENVQDTGEDGAGTGTTDGDGDR